MIAKAEKMAGLDEAEGFAAAANAYCTYLDDLTSRPDYLALAELLADLVGARIRLPWPEDDDDDRAFDDLGSLVDVEFAPDASLRKRFSTDLDLLERQNHLDEGDKGPVLVVCRDLAELYGELKDGLRCWRWVNEKHNCMPCGSGSLERRTAACI